MDINLINRYKSARSSLIAYLVLTVINTVVIAIGMDLNFIYADFAVPVSFVLATQLFRGTGAFLLILTGVAGPLLILGAAYLLSGKNHKALLLAAITILFETLKLVVYMALFYDGFPFVLEVIVGIIVTGIQFFGFTGGKKFFKTTGDNITNYIG